MSDTAPSTNAPLSAESLTPLESGTQRNVTARHPPDPQHSSEEQSFDVGSWTKGAPYGSSVFKWYRNLSGDSIKIAKLQVWKRSNYETLTHRFVAVHMVDGAVHRLDRRAAAQADPQILSGLSFGAGNTAVGKVETEDQMDVDIDRDELEKRNKLEIEVDLEGRVELEVVLLTCYAISQHDKGKKYDIREHNCFFFSWTILMIAARYRLPAEPPNQASLVKRFKSKDHAPVLGKTLAANGEIILRDMVLTTISVVKEQYHEDSEEGEAIRKGMSHLARTIWGLPKGVLEGFGKLLLNAKLLLSPSRRKTLDERIRTLMDGKALELSQRFRKHIDLETLRSPNHLWVDDVVMEHVQPGIQAALMDMLWPAIVSTCTEGWGPKDELAADIVEDVFQRKSWWFVGKRTNQLWAVQNATMYGGLRSIKVAAQEKTMAVKAEVEKQHPNDIPQQLKSLNARMFDLGWSSAREGALKLAQDAVKASRDLLEPKHHATVDPMWDAVWKVWDKCWEKAGDGYRETAISYNIVDAIVDATVKVVLEELSSETSQPVVSVRFPEEISSLKLNSPFSPDSGKWTSRGLQKCMQGLMKRAKFGRPDELQRTMADIWKLQRSVREEADIVNATRKPGDQEVNL
ncbi:hypothetical protein PQX77_003497 [Marasmius sp. AFHP31]|nr:hypothetical protein PQX77_003497 [Marasmius sp. AFHP31]